MKNESLYRKTVDILVQAYMNDTLQHSNCHACAVGNLVSANIGIEKFITKPDGLLIWSNGIPFWNDVHMFMSSVGIQNIDQTQYKDEAKNQIDATGYTWQQTAEIEKAFESALYGNSEDEWMLNGLMAVIDVLDKIHEVNDPDVTQKTKASFVKQTC